MVGALGMAKMTGSFCLHRGYAALFVVIFSFLSLSCGKTQLSAAPQFVVLLGNDQVLAPREASKQAIEFQMLDSSGLPVPSVPVELRLIPVEEAGGNLDSTAVIGLWDNQVKENVDLNSPSYVERVGRVDGSRFVTTDTQGKVSVLLIAPSLFSAQLIVVARTVSGEAVPDLVAFARVRTSSTEDAGKLTLESNFVSNAIPAGKNAEFWIVLRDQTGAIVTGYEGPAVFKFEAQKPSDSWAGLSSVNFRSEMSCNFIAGRCAVPGGPFNFAKAERLKISLQGLKPATSKVDTVIEVLKGEGAAQVIAADKSGGPESGAQPLRDITMKAGESVSLFAALIDEGGNYLGDAPDTRWLTSAQQFQEFLPADARIGFTLEPKVSGVFELKLNSVSARESSTIPVEVQAGSQTAWKVVTQNNGVETAGSCFRVTVSAVDAAGNVIPTVEGETLGLLEIAGTVTTPPLVNDVAHFTRLGLRISSGEAASRVNLRFGTGSTVEQVCLFDATDVSPKVVFSANGFTGETQVSVLKGLPAAVRLSRENTGDSATNACATPSSPDNIAKPCITFNSDEMLPPNPSPIKMYAALTDVAGNFISNTTAQWQVTGPLGELNPDGTAKFAIVDQMVGEQSLTTTLSGKGTFLITPSEGEISPQRFAYEVKHGLPASARVSTLEAGRQKTTQPFRIKATLLDQWNNLATTFTGSLNGVVSVDRAPAAPNGTESVAGFNWNMNFSLGGGELVSEETLQLPCACDPEVQPSAGLGCRDPQAGYETLTLDPSDPEKSTFACPKIKVNINGLGAFESESLTVLPDSLAELKLRNRAGGLGDNVADLYGDETPLEHEIFKPLVLYTAGYDALGNYRGETSSDITWQWLSAGMANAPNPEFQSRSVSPSLLASQTGDGRLTAVAVGNAAVSVQSPKIRFKSSRAVRYSITTNNTDPATGVTTETAGEPFNILLKAIDASGNVDPNFSGERVFTWLAVSDPSWDETMPILPSGSGFTCAFSAGVCLLQSSAESPEGWVIANALKPTLLSVLETTPEAQLNIGSERLSGTFAATIFVDSGTPSRLIYADKTGGPSAGAKVEFTSGEKIHLTTDETFSQLISVVDKGGNYLSELAEATIQGDTTYVTPFTSIATADSGLRLEFSPERKTPRADVSMSPDFVNLIVSSASDMSLLPLQIEFAIHHGRPQKAVTRLLKKDQSGQYSEPADTALVAGECYGLEVLVNDADDNEIDTLSGTALSKTGVRNFSVSQDYLNLNGGFYRFDPSTGNFSGFRFGVSDASFSGSEYTVRSRKVRGYQPGFSPTFQAGGFTNWEHVEHGRLSSAENLLFCVGDLQAAPEVVVNLVSGLTYRDKENVQQLAMPVSGVSQTHSVVAGAPVALTFFMNFADGNGGSKSVSIDGQSVSGMRLCTYGPNWGGSGIVSGSATLTPVSANAANLVHFSEDYQDCLAMNVDLGGLSISAKITDAAGNILSNTPSGSWNFVNYSSGSAPQVDASQFVQTATSFSDPMRRAGVFTLEYTESTTGLKATVVAKVKAGRASTFNLSVSPAVVATQAFNGWMHFFDAWGNPHCDGHYIPNVTGGFGWDPLTQSNTHHIPVPYKIEWLGTAPPTTFKVPVGRPLTADNSPLMRNATCALENVLGSGYFGSLQIPKTGQYTLQFSSDQLVDKQGATVVTAKIADINVLPGPVVRANVEYVNAPAGLAGMPTQGGQTLPAAYVPGETEPAPFEIKSFSFSDAPSDNAGIAVFLTGYDQEDNFNTALPSTVTALDSQLDEEFEYAWQESYVRARCDNLTRTVCSLSQREEQATADRVHVLVGQRTGVTTLEIRPTNPASTFVFNFKVRTLVGPDWQKQLMASEKDYSEVILPDDKTIEQIESDYTNAMVGSKLRFKLRVADYNYNTYVSIDGLQFVSFGFRSNTKVTKEGYENTLPSSGEYLFNSGVSAVTFSSQIYTAGQNGVTVGFEGDRYPEIVEFSGSGVIKPTEFHHYGTISKGTGAGGVYHPSSQLTDTFQTVLELRDFYGNVLQPADGPNLPVNLSIVREDGTLTPGPLVGTTQNIPLSSEDIQTEINDLKYPQAGKFKILASDVQGNTTPLIAASSIFMEPSFDVVNGFQLSHLNADPSTAALSLTAGQLTAFSAKAVDLYGGSVTGIDGILSSFVFNWSNVSAAPDGTAAVLPSSLTFTSGQAQVPVKFFKAEMIPKNTLTLSGSGAANQTLTTSYSGDLTIQPGAISEYRVDTCLPNLTSCDTTTKTLKAEKSADGFFDVKIETFDLWKNPRAGESGLSLIARKVSGPGDSSSGLLSSSGVNEDTAQETTNFNLAANNGYRVFSNLWYPIGHTVELDLNNASVSLAIKPQLEFVYTSNSIASYKLDFSSYNVVSGNNNLTVTITAQDAAKNTITGLDAELNSRQLIISGLMIAPNGTYPKINGALDALAYNSWPFSGGVATQNLSLYKAQTINTEAFLITDDKGVRGRNTQSPVVVSEGSVSQIRFRQSGQSGIPTQVAGQSFTPLATTSDDYGNLSDVDCADGLALGSVSASAGGWGGTSVPATIPAAQKNGRGEYSFTGVRITRAGTQNVPLTACSVARSPLAIQVNPDSVNRMVLKTANSIPATDDLGITGAGDLGELTCNNTVNGASITECGSVYSFFWDQFGNRIDAANNSCQWTWTNATAAHGLFIQAPPNLNGSGGSRSVSSTDFVDGILSCTRDSVTKQVQFWGGVAKLNADATFTSTDNQIVSLPNIPAGSSIALSNIQAWSSKGGNLVGLSSPAANATNGLSIASTLILKNMPTSPSCQFTNSVCAATYSGLLEASGVNGSVTLAMNGKSVVWNLTVDPGEAVSIDIANIPAQGTAGIPLSDLTIVVRDFYGNPTNTAAGGGLCNQLMLSAGAGLSSPGGRGLTQQAPSVVPPTPSVDPQKRGEYLSTLTFYKAGVNTLEIAGCGLNTLATLNVSPSVAALGNLSKQSTDTSVLTAASAFECAHENNTATSSSVSCGTINAFFWDDWGNSINSGNPVTCDTWQYETTAAQNGLPAATKPTESFSGGSATLSATDFVDGALTCIRDGKTAQSKIYGGVAAISVESSTPSALTDANLIAASNNVTLGQIQLWQRRDGTNVTKQTAGAETLQLKIETSGPNAFSDIVSNSESGFDAANGVITRSFNTTGMMTSPLSLSFKKAPLGNTNSFILSVKNKTVEFEGITVEPNNAQQFKFPTLAAQTAGVSFGFDIEILDQFNNRTSKKADGTDCSTSALVLSGSGDSPGPSPSSIGTRVSPDFNAVNGTNAMSATSGVYSLTNVTLFRAGGESLTVEACGLSAQSFALNVSAAPAAAGVLRKTAAISVTPDADVACSMHASANTVDCVGKSVYAYFWDEYGNTLVGEAAKCDSWAFAPLNRPDAVSVSSAAAASVALTNKGTHTYVDGAVSCTKSPLADPLSMEVWGGVKEVFITAKDAANNDVTNNNPNLTSALGNLKITQIDLKTTKGGSAIASPLSQTRQVTWNTTATIQGWGTGGTGSTTQIGQAQQQNLAFTSGTLAGNYLFNFIKAEQNKEVSVTVYGLTSNSVGFSVVPTVANDIRLNKVNGTDASVFPQLTAGAPFSFEAEVLDAFGNNTQVSSAAGNPSCAADTLTVDLGAGQMAASPGSSPTSLGAVSSFPASGVSVALSGGLYTANNIQLFNTTNSALKLDACGLSEEFAVSVNAAAPAHVAVNTSATAAANQMTELECDNSGTNGLIRCDALYAYFWDQYGNRRSSDSCDSWSFASTDGAPVPSAFGGGATLSNAASLTQANLTGGNAADRYFDGALSCANNRGGFTTSPQIRLWGGVSKVTISHSVSGSSVAASLGNVQVSSVSVQTPKNGVLSSPTKNLNKSIRFLTNASDAELQGSPNVALTNSEATTAATGCNFGVSGNEAVCDVSATPYIFNFTRAEQSRTFDVAVHGVMATPQVGFDVTGGGANSITVTSVPTQVTAGVDFNLDLAVKDAWGNPTATGCGAVTITGPTASQGAGPAGAIAQGFSLASVAGASEPVAANLGVYNLQNLKLYDTRAAQTLSISACGLNVTSSPSVTVKPAAPQFATLTISNARAATTGGEFICSNASTTPYAVSCSGHTAYAWFWDTFGNEINSSSKSGANDHLCDSWSFAAQSGAPTTFAASGASPSLSSSISVSSGSPSYVDGTLSCVKSGVVSPEIRVWGGVKSVDITAVKSDGTTDMTSSNPTLTAAVGNIRVNSVRLKTTKAGVELDSPVTANVDVLWDTDATVAGGWGAGGANGDATPFGQTQTTSVAFSGGLNSASHAFNMVKTDTSKKLWASVFGVQSNQVGFSVQAAAVSTLQLAATPTTVNAGQSVSLTASGTDEFNNPSFTGCTTVELSTVVNLDSPSGQAPVFSSNLLNQSATLGTFESATVTLKKAAGGQVLRASGCGTSGDSAEITVNPASITQILLSTANTQPAYNTTLSEASDLSCTSGTTVSCPTIYAFGEDSYGNPLGTMSCGTWTFTADTGTAASLSQTSGISTTATNATTHIDGTLRCDAGGLSRTVPLFGQIQKSPSFSCSAWACSNTTPTSTCNVSNKPGYDIASLNFSGPAIATNNCTAPLASGNSCSLIYNGTVGQITPTATLESTAQEPTQVAFSAVASTIGGGVNAPNCTQTLLITNSGWTCNGSVPELEITFTNNDGTEAFAVATGSPSLTIANSGTLSNNTCSGSIAAGGGSCSLKVSGTQAGSTSTVELATSGSFFFNSSYTTPAAPTCP